MNKFLETNIKFLKGMGEKRAELFSKSIEVSTVRDLLYYFPFRHVDRSKLYNIKDISGAEAAYIQIKGRFINFRIEGEGLRKRLVAIFTDGERHIEVIWFSKFNNIPERYPSNTDFIIFGKPNYYNGSYSFVHPEIERYDPMKPPAGFRGIYSQVDSFKKKGGNSNLIQKIVKNALNNTYFQTIPENLPANLISQFHLMPIKEAFRQIHFPTDLNSLQKAIERFKFEELYYVELHILRYSMERGAKIAGLRFRRIGEFFNKFYSEVLPFNLTEAQKRVIREIRNDMNTGRQMNRLLQGDVGSGKTMVAFMTMLIAADNNHQAALMAPTEILARQHYNSLRQWADPIGLKVGILTGSTKKSERKIIHQQLESGELNILVGTHALLEENVKFSSLGLAVIDEQHRFGVAQRARLWKKNTIAPHVLVMTATPIPRTLAMTVYGDLEVSVIDELPPGRKPIETLLRFDNNRLEVDRLVFSQLREGRQVYIVYPLINENEKLDLKSLEEGYIRTKDIFDKYNVCYVHGKMKQDEKDRQMEKFVSGEARIMVATTVIEVGVNVPNASVMIIENAERFGLSQLHQLRGRVGRGADKSYCVLMGKASSGADTKKRLRIMTETTDGFLISEADMKMRGPGDMEGTMQSGMAFNLRLANLAKDGQILTLARNAALSTLYGAPSLLAPGLTPPPGKESDPSPYCITEAEKEILAEELQRRFAHSIDWSRIS